MYCPTCGAEYLEGIRFCADCQVALVIEQPQLSGERTTENSEQTVRVWRGFDPFQAQWMRQVLNQSGIDCLADRDPGMLPTGEFGEIGLWVRNRDEKRARELLQELGKQMSRSEVGDVVEEEEWGENAEARSKSAQKGAGNG